jgi:uncharacterized membrane protein
LHQPPDIFLFIGRFHVLLVHLPIGMLAALATLEIVAWITRFKNANASAGFILALAAPLAVVTAICGWLLSLGGGYDETLLAWHKWLGTITAVTALVAAILFWRRSFFAYRASLFLTVGLLMAAGHLGGSLTHGSDYLMRYAPAPIKKILGIAAVKNTPPTVSMNELRSLPVFTGIIEPIFTSKCVSCHGAEKAKGGLRLDSFAALQAGGKDDVAIKSGDVAQSPIVQRALLPVGEDDHMPPEGKPQLTAAEISVFKWWISSGAPETNTLDQLKPPAEILAALSAK